jgi:long-chain acyl-CoA synthetase
MRPACRFDATSKTAVSEDSARRYRELKEKTLPGLLLERMKNAPDGVAYRAKKLGIYKETTWSDFARMVAHCAVSLQGLGLKRGDRLALMGDPSEEYVLCELAAQALGAVTYGIYPSSSGKELRYLMENGGASVFVAANQEHVDRILAIFEGLKELRHVVVIDTKGTFMHDHAALLSFEELMGKAKHKGDSAWPLFEERVGQIKSTDIAFIAYTSGTTGSPKGAIVSHGRHLAATSTFLDRYPSLREFPHRTVLHLPLSHMLGRIAAITLPLLTRIVPHYGESIEDLSQTLFETAPTLLLTVPRYLQKMGSNIEAGIQNTTPLKKFFYRQAVQMGRYRLEGLWNGRKKAVVAELFHGLARGTVFRPILNKLGLDKLQIVICSDSSLAPDIMTLWQTYGVNLSEVYMQAETGGGIITAQEPYFPRPDHVGKAPAGWEVKLSERGEILVKASDAFEGYWNRPDLMQDMKARDGWFSTGDLGEWTSQGNLRVVERAQDIIKTLAGKTLGPSAIESLLKSCAYISEAIIIGQNREHISALVEIDVETVSGWAQQNNLSHSGLESLIEHQAIVELIGKEIGRANERLPSDERIQSFRMIPGVLDPAVDDAPVTPTRKVRRQRICHAFQDLIESMYSGKEEKGADDSLGGRG